MSDFSVAETHVGVTVTVCVSVDPAYFTSSALDVIPCLKSAVTDGGKALRETARQRALETCASIGDSLHKVAVARAENIAKLHAADKAAAVNSTMNDMRAVINDLDDTICTLQTADRAREARNAARRGVKPAKATRK